jgi:replicative superfamily II helicase
MVDGSGSATHLLQDGTNRMEAGFIVPALVYGGQGSKQVMIPLVQKLVAEGKKVIVFRSIKGETVGSASYLSASLGLPPSESVLALLPGRDLSSSSESLRVALRGGVGFHNADLSPEERTALEAQFRDPESDIKVLVATTTLAMGINTPAEAVVIAGLTHPGPTPTRYSVAEYKNMVGRAGRLGFSETGESYIIATGDPAPHESWSRYILGQPEDVTSHFLDASTDPQTMILRSIVALGGSVAEDELLALLENSFAIWQRVDGGGTGWDRGVLQRDLQALVDAGLLDVEPGGSLTVTELGRFAGESGLEVRSVTQVSSLLRFATGPLSTADLVAVAQVTVEMDAMYLSVASRSRQEQARWPQTLIGLGVSYQLLNGMHVGGGSALARQKKAAAALRFASAVPIASVEFELMQHMRNRSAAGPIRATAGRTRDVIDSVATICRVRGISLADDAAAERLGIRLEIGLPDELAELANKVGNTLTRANYLDLLSVGISDEVAILAASDEQLISILGESVTMALKDLLAD